MAWGTTWLAVVPVRKEPSHRSEMITQLTFGETAEFLEEVGDFTQIRCTFDGYEGWAQTSQLAIEPGAINWQTDRFTTGWTQQVHTPDGKVRVPFGSPYYSKSSPGGLPEPLSGLSYEYAGDRQYQAGAVPFSDQALQDVYSVYLNTPYLWGGRTVFGIDCSGFAQQVAKLFGISLLRDAYQQATQGTEQAYSDARSGDLAFFHNTQGRIIHVGFVLPDKKIVHASGNVRIDDLDEEGIVRVRTGKRTHQLCCIRRIFTR
jgi:gamma-D-glutamyl-L-lysine dipeptidyl-peptidase